MEYTSPGMSHGSEVSQREVQSRVRPVGSDTNAQPELATVPMHWAAWAQLQKPQNEIHDVVPVEVLNIIAIPNNTTACNIETLRAHRG